jgi:hypothetical protein
MQAQMSAPGGQAVRGGEGNGRNTLHAAIIIGSAGSSTRRARIILSHLTPICALRVAERFRQSEKR